MILKIAILVFLIVAVAMDTVVLWCIVGLKDDVFDMKNGYLDLLEKEVAQVNDSFEHWRECIDKWEGTANLCREILDLNHNLVECIMSEDTK